MNGSWFTSARFVTSSADGTSQLAAWLAAELESFGYSAEPAIEEDWGYCIVLSRKPFLLWVGIGDVQPASPHSSESIWHCFPAAEVRLISRLFGKPDTGIALSKLDSILHAILAKQPDFALMAEPSV